MKAKALMIGSIFVAILLIAVNTSWAKGGIAHRQMKQSNRITDGLKSGEITHRELVRLNKEQWRIQQAIRKAWADGRLKPHERRRIHRLQDRASKHIYRHKHNRVKRYRSRPYHRHRHYRHRPVHYGYHFHHRYRPTYYGTYFKGRYSEPHYSFAWSVGWR